MGSVLEGVVVRKIGIVVACATVTVMLAFGLAGCGGEATKGPVYLKSKQTYYDTSSGEVQSELTWTYDAKGNKVKRLTKTVRNGSEVNVEDSYGDFDQDGYPATHSSKSGTDLIDSTYEYTKENGRVVKAVESDGSEDVYTYYDDGKVKTREHTSKSGWKNLYEYDESGYVIKNESSGDSGGDSKSTVMWTKDNNGIPTNMVFNSTSSGKSQVPISYTLQCDDNGNIIRAYTSLGKLYEEVEYTKIDSPSLAAWVEGHMVSA